MTVQPCVLSSDRKGNGKEPNFDLPSVFYSVTSLTI